MCKVKLTGQCHDSSLPCEYDGEHVGSPVQVHWGITNHLHSCLIHERLMGSRREGQGYQECLQESPSVQG